MKRSSYKIHKIHRKTPEPEQCAMIIPKHKQHRLHAKKNVSFNENGCRKEAFN